MNQLSLFNLDSLPKVSSVWTTRPLARRVHTCSVCSAPIAIGSRYERIVTVNRDALLAKHRMQIVRWHLPYCPEGAAGAGAADRRGE